MKKFILLSISVVCSFSLSAGLISGEEFSEVNADGKMIFYEIIDDDNVIVVNEPYNADPVYAYAGTISIPESASHDGITYNVKEIDESAFRDNVDIEHIVISNSVDTIGGFAFFNCLGLKSVTAGSGLVFLGGSAFKDCDALQKVDFGTSFAVISGNAFTDCAHIDTFICRSIAPPVHTSMLIYNAPIEEVVYSSATLFIPEDSEADYAANIVWRPFQNVKYLTDLPVAVPVVNDVAVNIYPNPAQNDINITGIDIKLAEIYNLVGAKLLQSSVSQIDISQLAKGNYIIKIIDTNNKLITKKFVKL